MSQNQIHEFYDLIKEMHKDCDDKIDQPIPITTRLKSYQRKAVKWMVKREKNNNLMKNNLSEFRGGILADDIGLGKTLEMLGCIASNRPPLEFRAIFPTPNVKSCLPFLNEKILNHEPMNCTFQLPEKMINHIVNNKPNSIVTKTGLDNSLYILNCYCHITPMDSTLVICALCGQAQHKECVNFKPKPFQDNLYLCPSCWHLNDKIDCKATLIIVPLTIMNQWIDEVEKHASKLKVFVYNGMYSEGYIEPTMFNEYDIVITSYSHLEDNLNIMETLYPESFLKFNRRHESPMLCLNWWRICLDYDINHLCSLTLKTISKLTCVNKWVMNGTLIEKSLKDFEVILKFLDVKKYYMRNESYTNTPQIANIKWIWFSCLLWRNSANDVNDELNLQESTIKHNYLKLPQIEKYYYEIHKNHTVDLFHYAVIKQNMNMETKLKKLDYSTQENLFEKPVLKLRQVCLHPQNAKGDFIKLIETIPMGEVTDIMVEKSGDECDNILVTIISHHNEIAELYIKSNQIFSAIDEYKIILDLIQKHEDKNLNTDGCQKMRALYNLDNLLNEIRIGDEDIYASNGLNNLKEEIEILEKDHLDAYKHKVEETCKMVQLHVDEIVALTDNRKPIFPRNWPDMKDFIISQTDFMTKANANWLDYCSTDVLDTGHSFRSIERMFTNINLWSIQIHISRDDVMKFIELLKDTPIDLLVNKAMACHLNQASEMNVWIEKCTVCRTRFALSVYRSLLFSLSYEQNSISLETLVKYRINDNDLWKTSLEEFLLTLLLEYGQAKFQNTEKFKNSVELLKVIESMRKEYLHILQLWSYFNDYISTYFEINLHAKSILLDFEAKPTDSENSSSTIQLTENEERERDTIETTKMQFKIVLLKSQIEIDQSDLIRNYGKFQYLNNFKRNEEMYIENEPCTICSLENEYCSWAVFQCGHKICKQCLFTLHSDLENPVVRCPVCRNYTPTNILYYGKKSNIIENPCMAVKGTFSIKIESITLKLMELINKDPTVKVLIFSTWEKSLELLKEALEQNSINHRILKLGNEYQKTLKAFKTNIKINALLLRISLSSKGLNLTEATRVFFMEPIIKKADELEAIGRIRRIGQTKPTFVHHFIIQDTIEETLNNEISNFINGDNLTLSQIVNLYKNKSIETQ